LSFAFSYFNEYNILPNMTQADVSENPFVIERVQYDNENLKLG